GSNKFFINLLTKDGINECGSIQGIGTSLGNDELNNQGQIKTSSDGSYLAICHNTGMKVEVYYFNNRNGQLQLAKTINTTSFSSGILPYSLDFSSNSQFLYIFLRDSHILQYNLLKDTIVSLIKLSSGSWGQSSRTSNGKIVFHKMDSSNLCAIKFENTDTPKVDFNYISIFPRKTLASIPNFNQSYFYTPSIDFAYDYNCLQNTLSFEGRDTFYADSFHWQTRKVYGAVESSAYIKKPIISFQDTGMYEIRFIATKGSRSDTVVKQLEIHSKLEKDFLGRDTMYSSDVPFSLQLNVPSGMHC